VAIDTSVFIFHVEENPRYVELADAVFDWLETPRAHAVTSTITMLELLCQPYRASDIHRVNRFYALLTTYQNLDWIPPTLEQADLGARLRADHDLKTPDAIQAATALACQATGFVSNDRNLRKVAGLEVIVLDDLLAPGRP
jgi:predicted nucleic acid-binding protein